MGRDPPRSLGMLNANPAIEHRGSRSRETWSIGLRIDRFQNTSRPARTKHLSLFKIGCQKPGGPFCERTLRVFLRIPVTSGIGVPLEMLL